ncbi:hypothetical protein NLJ89_g6392 [Agrocybe chaxingu]|uniref:Small ribosomal subunit protein mS35 mitochondrial conserved domain-containing protein n=1 Tax=Agrocybe chaxingu TaxID=84603 RepID=A0A9W8K0V8_9AGAR|nr:hypothetical protein NLJ89_g6392 [Agrocybe chaxingu]
MAQSLARCLSLSKTLRARHVAEIASLRCFNTSSVLLRRRPPVAEQVGRRRTSPVIEDDMEELWDQLEEHGEVEDSPSGGHIIMQQQRETLHYLRLIEHEMPKLVAYRKQFVPPPAEHSLIVRSVHYQGESHPAALKRVIVVPVDKLPLKTEAATHKLILLAGPRWTPNPSADAGVSGLDDWGNGYVKISCEDFPEASMNLKWASDTLDKLVEEANNERDDFSDVPIDLRHLYAKALKSKKGDHLRSRVFHRPSIADFPKEWLPDTPASS